MDYQSNSKKNKEESKKPAKPEIEKVVTGEVIEKPKSVGRKFKDIFFGGNVKDTSKRVVGEVLLPAMRNMLFDAVDRGVSGFAAGVIFGDPHRRRTPRPEEYRTRVSYHDSFIREPRERERPRLPDQYPRRERRESKDYIVASREEADLVVERMYDSLNHYDVVSLGDLLELLGRPTSPIDYKWGWTYLQNVSIRQVRDGYLIDLPAAEAI